MEKERESERRKLGREREREIMDWGANGEREREMNGER